MCLVIAALFNSKRGGKMSTKLSDMDAQQQLAAHMGSEQADSLDESQEEEQIDEGIVELGGNPYVPAFSIFLVLSLAIGIVVAATYYQWRVDDTTPYSMWYITHAAWILDIALLSVTATLAVVANRQYLAGVFTMLSLAAGSLFMVLTFSQ